MIKFAIKGTSVIHDAIKSGDIFFDDIDDSEIKEKIFDKIGKPLRSKILLLPIKSRGKTVAVVYGDYGDKEISPVQIDRLAIISSHAGLVLENLLNRKKLDKKSNN